MKATFRNALKYIVPLGALALAIGITAFLIIRREAPQRAPPRMEGALVTAQTVERQPQRRLVQAQGTILPARSVVLQPQVSGQIVEINPQLVPGGILKKGEMVARIDPRDYQIAVDQERGALQQARAQLALEEGQQRVAQRELDLFQEEFGVKERNPELALRQPQLQSARAAVEAAAARLKRAELDLARTTLTAPFDSFVRSESVEVGQFVSPQSSIATLVGTETFWVQVSVPAADLPYLAIPGFNAATGSLARIRYDAGGASVEREGELLRLYGSLDPAGRMAQLLVSIQDPLRLDPGARGTHGVPLLVDAYVEATLLGREAQPLVAVPSVAVHEGGQAYVVTPAGTLDIREVEIAWRGPDRVYIRSGLQAGDRVVTSRIATPVEGMRLRVQESPAPATNRTEGPSGG